MESYINDKIKIKNMEIILNKKPVNATIIEGFPGFGLVGTISTEFLIEHLEAKQIGKVKVEENAPVIAVHDGKVVEPIGIFYSAKKNLIILHALTTIHGIEWKLANMVEKLATMVKAKEIISIEGVGNPAATDNLNAYYLSNTKNGLEKLGIKGLKEGIVMGVTGALLLNKKLKLQSLFVETHSTLPDSRAAAKALEILNKYLNLKIDVKPLLEKAQKFEGKIKDLIQKSDNASKIQHTKELSYLG